MPMYEFDQYESRLNSCNTRPQQPYTPFSNASKRAFLLWSEHCSECAAPDCYNTCHLYQPRPDHRCRRFEFGMFPNRAFPTGNGLAAEVVFKHWGLIIARGNATMLPLNRVRRMEQIASAVRPLANRVGRVLDRIAKDSRFSYVTYALLERLNQRLLERRDPAVRPDAFVFECYNPNSSEVVMRLSVAVERTKLSPSVRVDQLPPPFVVRFSIPPGYFRRDIPFEQLSPVIDTLLPFGISIVPEAGEGVHLVFLTLDFVVYDKPEAPPNVTVISTLTTIQPADPPPLAATTPGQAARPAAKCVVFDLDNTLWQGILLEGDVALRPAVKELLGILDSRGILLSIASRNSHEHAYGKLVEMGIAEYFLFPRINWGRKSESLKAIAKDIDIGIDTLIFIDDNPFDRGDVTGTLPQVEVLDETSLANLVEHPRLKGSSSAEARTRRLMYRQAEIRSAAAQEFGDDYIGFLGSCRIRVEIRPPAPADWERICELVQRTNQLNFSGRKYKNDEVEVVLTDSSLEKYVLTYSDKYGSCGIVGFCIAQRSPRSVCLVDFMLSCRVQGKLVEQALFHHLINNPPSTERLEINFKKTDRNAPAQAVLQKLGFDTRQDGVLMRNVACGDFEVNFMEVVETFSAQTVVEGGLLERS